MTSTRLDLVVVLQITVVMVPEVNPSAHRPPMRPYTAIVTGCLGVPSAFMSASWEALLPSVHLGSMPRAPHFQCSISALGSRARALIPSDP
jgi:hypothetical protein